MKVEYDKNGGKISTRIVSKAPTTPDEANREIHVVVPVTVDDFFFGELVMRFDFHEGATEEEVVGDIIEDIENGEYLGLPHWKR